MEYTQKQMDDLINNPILQMLCSITGTPVEEFVKPITTESESNKPSVEKDDTDKLYPLDIEDLANIVNSIKEVYTESNRLEDLGFDFWASNIGYAVYNCIRTLLPYIHDAFEDTDKFDSRYNFFDASVEDIVEQMYNDIND